MPLAYLCLLPRPQQRQHKDNSNGCTSQLCVYFKENIDQMSRNLTWPSLTLPCLQLEFLCRGKNTDKQIGERRKAPFVSYFVTKPIEWLFVFVLSCSFVVLRPTVTSIVSVFCKMSESSPRLTLSLPGRGDMETQPTISYLNVPGIQHNCHGMAMRQCRINMWCFFLNITHM